MTKTDQAQTEAGKLFAEQNAIFDELEAQEEALMAPIRERLEAIRARYREVGDEYAQKIGKSLKSVTMEELSDPFLAVELQEASWNNQRGVPGGSREIYESVAEGTYISSAASYSYGNILDPEHLRPIYTTPQISIPKRFDQEKLARTAEVLEPIHLANMEIVGDSTDARIAILEDSCGYNGSFYIIYDSEEENWELHGGYTGQSFKTLLEALRAAPTYS